MRRRLTTTFFLTALAVFFCGRMLAQSLNTVVINVAAYGAVPDDGKDDTAAIRAAFAARHPGDTVAFADGVYNINETIVPPGDCTYTGTKKTVIRKSGGKQAWYFRGATANWRIDGLKFDGGGVDMDDANNVLIINTTIVNVGGGNEGEGCGIHWFKLQHAQIVYNTIDGAAGWAGIFGRGTNEVKVEHNYVANCASDGIHYMQGINGATGCTVNYNVFRFIRRCPGELQDGKNIGFSTLTIRGNDVRQMLLDWVKPGADLFGYAFSVPPQYSTNTIFEDNYCDATCSGMLEFMSKGGRIANNILDGYRGQSWSGSQRTSIMCDGMASGPIVFANNIVGDITGVVGGPNGVFPKITGFPAGTTGIETTQYLKTVVAPPAPVAGAYAQGGGTTQPVPPAIAMSVTGVADSNATAVISIYNPPKDAVAFQLGLYPSSLAPQNTTVDFGTISADKYAWAVNTTYRDDKGVALNNGDTTPSWYLTPVVKIVGGDADGLIIVGAKFQCPLNAAGITPPPTTQPSTQPTTRPGDAELDALIMSVDETYKQQVAIDAEMQRLAGNVHQMTTNWAKVKQDAHATTNPATLP